MNQFETDRPFLANKYHRVDEPFNNRNCRAYHGLGYDLSSGLGDEEMLKGLDELAAQSEGLSHPVAKARAFAYVLDHTPLYNAEHDIFPGIWSWGRLIAPTTVNRWRDEVLSTIPEPLCHLAPNGNRAGLLRLYPDYEHSIPDADEFLSRGFPGVLARVRDFRERHRVAGTLTRDRADVFEGVETAYAAIVRLLGRMAKHAAARPGARAGALATALAHLRDGAPTDTYEALIALYLYHILSECVDCYQVRSLGNGLDTTLRPFIRKDLATGRRTVDEIREQLSYYLFQFAAMDHFWGHPFYLGGQDARGNNLADDISMLILDTYASLRLTTPKLQVKVGAMTPAAFRRRALDIVRGGATNLVFVCEEGRIEAMRSYGVSLEDARTADISGCYEYHVKGKEVVTLPIWINFLKPIQLALHNGTDPDTGLRLGPGTGDAATLATYADFERAYLAQLDAVLEESIRYTDAYERELDTINPSLMFSGGHPSSLERGELCYGLGMEYNNSGILVTGFASAVDSLLAVRELVYERRLVTLAELRDICAANWEGHDRLLATARALEKRFGVHDPEADACAAALSEHFLALVNLRPNARGGIYKAGLHSADQFVIFGNQLGATPDGRRRGEEVSKNATPCVGADRKGATALILSALALHPARYTEDFCVDMMLHPSAVAGEEGLDAFDALLETYRRGGGGAIQFNIVDAAPLRDAQEHPEKYRNLQVRICGWNVRWSELSRKEQDAYIARAESYDR